MLVAISHCYTATVRRHRARLDSFRTCRATTTVEVATAAIDDAPVALRYRDPNHLNFGAPEHVELRGLGGRLLRVVMTANQTHHPVTARDAGWLLSAAADPSIHGRPFGLDTDDKWTKAGNSPQSDPSVKTILSTDRDAVASHLHAWASRSVLLDGALWTAVPEPVVVYDPNPKTEDNFAAKYGIDTVYSIDETFDAMKHPGLDLQFFRADRRDLARRLIGGWNTKINSFPSFEVLDPSALKFRDDDFLLRRAASALGGAMNRVLGNDTTPIFVGSARKLLAMTKAFDANFDSADLQREPLLAAVKEAMEATDPWPEDASTGSRHSASRALSACRRIFERLDIGTELAPDTGDDESVLANAFR
jgi:hypothetical protein